jgi:hypothetical protein
LLETMPGPLDQIALRLEPLNDGAAVRGPEAG